MQASLDGLTRPNGGTDAVAPKPPFLAADAFSNPDYQRYTLKTTAAAVICYLTYSLIAWQGIHTAMITCYVAALGTTGETVHKLALRISGCLVGAAIGLLCILFVIPHLGSVGGLMVLVFFGVLPGPGYRPATSASPMPGCRWGSPSCSPSSTVFAPSLDMASARDRVVGILLGNLVVYLIFTGIWPKSAVADVRDRLARVLAALSRLAALEPAARAAALDDAARVEAEAEKACEQLRLLPFEPASQRPAPAGIARLHALIAETRALLPPLMFCQGRNRARSPSGFPRVGAGLRHGRWRRHGWGGRRRAGRARLACRARAPHRTAGGEVTGMARWSMPGLSPRRAELAKRGLAVLACALLTACATNALDTAPADPSQPWTPTAQSATPADASPAQPAPPADAETTPQARTETAPVRDFSVPSEPVAGVLKPTPDISRDKPYGLADLIDIAQNRNPATRIAWQQARQAALASGMVEATYLPLITANVIGGYQKYENPLPLAIGSVNQITSTTQGISPQVALQWLVFDFGQRGSVHEVAKHNATAANVLFNGLHRRSSMMSPGPISSMARRAVAWASPHRT